MTGVLACHKCDQGVFNECMMFLRIGYFCRQCSEKAVPISVNLSYLCRLFQFRLFLTPDTVHGMRSLTICSRLLWYCHQADVVGLKGNFLGPIGLGPILPKIFIFKKYSRPPQYSNGGPLRNTASRAYSNNGGPLRKTADFKTLVGLSPHYRGYVKQTVRVILIDI